MYLAAILSFIFFSITPISTCFAETPSMSQIERTQESLDQQKALIEKLDKQGRVFIKDISIKRATQLSNEEIKIITQSFENKWLGRAGIEQLIGLIRQSYKQKKIQIPTITYQIKQDSLEISVTELNR